MVANSHRKMILMFKLLRLGFLTAVITATVAATTVNSHSGGLNSQGCHAGSRPYHCHRSSSEMVPSTSGGYRLRCGAGSRSKDLGGVLFHDMTEKRLSMFSIFWLLTAEAYNQVL